MSVKQGEVITDLWVPRRLQESEGGFSDKVTFDKQRIAIVLNQDCDLEFDHEARFRRGKVHKLLSTVLLCEVVPSSELQKFGDDPSIRGSDKWKQVTQNNCERYHYLAAVPAGTDATGEGLPTLAVDFKKYFTLRGEDLYDQIARDAKRRCVLIIPYNQQLASRFFAFQSRVAVPIPHDQIETP